MPDRSLLDAVSWLIQLVQTDGPVEPFRLLLQLAQILIPLAIAVPPVASTVGPGPRLRSPILLSWLSVVAMVGLLSLESCRLCVMRVLPPPLGLFLAAAFLVTLCLYPFVAHALVRYLDVRTEEDRIHQLRQSAGDALRADVSAFLRRHDVGPGVS